MVKQIDNPIWLEGYNFLGPKSRNPYSMDVLTDEGRYNYKLWEQGWEARFYGE